MDKIKAKVIFVIFVSAIFFFVAQGAWAAMPEFHGFAEFAYGSKVSDDKIDVSHAYICCWDFSVRFADMGKFLSTLVVMLL